MKSNPQAKRERGGGEFHDGMIAALAVVHLHDRPSIFDEIVGTTDALELVARARKQGAMRWSGLDLYVKRSRAHPKGRSGK